MKHYFNRKWFLGCGLWILEAMGHLYLNVPLYGCIEIDPEIVNDLGEPDNIW